MNPTTRLIVGFAILFVVHIFLGGTTIFLVRWWKEIAPIWSWPKAMGAYLLMSLIVTGIAFVPVIGRIVAPPVSLVGLKRLSGLDILQTIMLSFGLGISLLACAAMLDRHLHVNLLNP